MISIIIVSWNVKDLLRKCLHSIEAFANDAEVIVVDNASNDGSVEMIQKEFPNVKLVANTHNVGFAKANNQGVEIATGEYVLFLNPDTELHPESLSKSLEAIKNNPKIGILGCQLHNPDGTIQPSVRRFPTVETILALALKLGKVFPDLQVLKKYLAADFDYSKSQVVDQVMGAFMLLRPNVIAKPIFDERYFIWFEEVDLCRRVKAAGYDVYYFADAAITHHGGQSFAQQPVVAKQWLFFKSAAQYLWKWKFRT